MSETATKPEQTMLTSERADWSRERYEQDRLRLLKALDADCETAFQASAAFGQELERYRQTLAEKDAEIVRLRRTVQEREAKIAEQADLLAKMPSIRARLAEARTDAKRAADVCGQLMRQLP